MKFKEQTLEAIIHKRYKRFLADIELPGGEMVVAHVPNTGSMKNCWAKGQRVIITHSQDPARKLKYTLQLVHNGQCWIGVNTGMTNHIAKEALEQNFISELTGYAEILPEQKIHDSRIDFLLKGHPHLPDAYVEVKNVTLVEQGRASFPDAVSTRGQKHLADLIKIKNSGLRAVMLYVVNRGDAHCFGPADDIDPIYGQMLREAAQAGVEILVYKCTHSDKEISINNKVEFEL